jgi:predicted lipoprotein with Yx(FWY)xxD motif
MAVALATGAGLAVLTGIALAKTFTLKVAKTAKVTSVTTMQTVTEPIAVSKNGHAVYTLSGDTIHHAECTKANGCFTFWPPVTVSSAKPKPTAAAGIKGRLGTKKLGSKFQVTLNGHPLYNYSGDAQKARAGGEGVQAFGGTWHVVKASGSTAGSTTTGTTTTGTTTTTPCIYPPCY